MVFIHGLCGHADVWAEQAARLSDRVTCVRYDRRGHGRSSRGSAAICPTRHADDAAALIEALDLAPCLAVGSSSGAVIALDLAMRHRGLCGVSSSASRRSSASTPTRARRSCASSRPASMRPSAEGDLRAGVDAFMSIVCAEMWSMLDEDRKDRLRDNAEIGFRDLQAPPLEVRPADLAAVTIPALVVAGTTSHPAFSSVARRLAGGLPDARLVEIDGGHVPYLEHPDAFATSCRCSPPSSTTGPGLPGRRG